jgi:hypothetical protein
MDLYANFARIPDCVPALYYADNLKISSLTLEGCGLQSNPLMG